MILSAQIIAAVFSLANMSVNRLPDFSVPRVTVETIYPGMAAGEIRSLVTIPLEDGLSPVKGLEKIQSISLDNRSIISMDFRWDTDPMAASVLVREAVDAVYPGLPEGVRKPTVTSGSSVGEPHAVIAVSSHNGDGEFARKLAEYELRARLRRIDGVGSVVLAGGETKEERLSLDVPRLAALGLSPSDFVSLLAQETSDIPAGNAREGNMELVVVSSGRPDSTSSLAQIILPAANGTLRVMDTGILGPASARRESVFVFDGKEAAALEIYRRPGSDPLRLSREIKKTVNEASSLFSRDAQIEIVIDSSPSLISGITSLLISAAFGAAAVITILFLFICRLRYSLLASLSIPFSAAAGICALYMTGRSLNIMSLSGLAMGIGLVSDISVLILDLLHRAFGKRDAAPSPEETGIRAFSIAGSSIASTVTTALVFIPVIFLPGPLGSLFGDISISLVASVSAGWFYAQFCLPSLYRMFFKTSAVIGTVLNKSKNPINKVMSVFTDGSLEKKYKHCLLLLFQRPVMFFAIASFLTLLGCLSMLMMPMVFFNPDDAEEVLVFVKFMPGTVLETAGNIGASITYSLSGLPFVKTVYGRAGAEEEDTNRRANIDYTREELVLRCVLEKGVNPAKALPEINAALASMEHAGISYSVRFPKDTTEVLLGLTAESSFVIKGKDRNELLERMEVIQNEFRAASITAGFRPVGKRPELRLYPDREASAFLSIPAAQIAETLYVLNEGVVASRLEIEGRPLDVRVTGAGYGQDDPVRYIENLPLITAQGKTVYLGSLGRIERREAEASLARLDRSDVLYTDIPADRNSLVRVREIAARFPWFTGADESVFNRYKNSLVLYVILVLVLLYMTMGAQFESFLLPLILMMSIPLSLAGAGPVLLLVSGKIDSGAVLGLAALFGLVVNNSLILFEISNEKINAGLSPDDAVVYGASERLQAILITMATTIFALLPLILSPMGNSQKSMASAMLGGLAASTLLSLFAIPPVLIRFFRWKLKIKLQMNLHTADVK